LQLGGVAALAVAAAVLAFASGGRAAGSSICLTPSTPTSNASCVSQSVAPHVVTANGDALSVTQFTNQSDGLTATHVVVRVTFQSTVTVKSITLSVNGSTVFSNPPATPAAPNPCNPPALPITEMSVSCSAGDIAPGGSVRLVVRFSTNTGVVLTGTASYGDDNQTAVDTLGIASAAIVAQGGCFNTAQISLAAATATQATKATVGRVSPSLGLPCTPVSVGIDTDPTHRPAGFQPVWFAEFKVSAESAFGTVTVRLASMPAGFVLKELTGSDPTSASSWTVVPNCLSSGLPPSGIDSCIFKKATPSYAEYGLHVLGSETDPRYSG
jgi:hypothetical protein